MANSDGAAWTDGELEDAVTAYLQMQQHEAAGQPYSKRAAYRELSQRYGRSESAFEYRMQNISAVLDGMDRPWLLGLKPATNVGDRNTSRLRKIIGSSSYRMKLPEMRQWMIHVARRRDKATYGDLMAAFNLDRFSLRAALARVGHQAKANGEPILTAVVVNQATRRCSEGIAKEFGVYDDEDERQKLYEFWSAKEISAPVPQDEADQSLPARAARFARVKIRPGQARFRRAVFLACKGCCVLTDCSLDRALDAAHRKGREWQKGHNKASDGILLRKDLHALYDAGRLRIDHKGVVKLDPEVAEHYPNLQGRRCSVWGANP